MELAEALSPERSGTRIAAIDLMNKRAKDLDAVKTLQEISSAPLKDELTRAQTRKYTADAAKDEEETAQTRRVMERLQQLPADEMEDPISRLEQIGNVQLEAGAVNAGSQTLQRAAAARASRAQANAAGVRAAAAQTKQELEELNFAQGLYSTARTPEEWEAAHAKYAQVRQQESPFARLPFSPALVEDLSRGLMTAKERAEQTLRQSEIEAREKNYDSQARLRSARIQAITTAERITREKHALAIKNGGERSPEARELKESLSALAKERAGLLKNRTSGLREDNPATVIPAAGERVPGGWYKNGSGTIARWHPTQGWIKQGQPFPELPATRGVAGRVEGARSFGSSLMNMVGLDDDDEDE